MRTDSALTVEIGRLLDPTRLGQRRRVGRFELVEPIGQGGMGCVYRALDPQLQRDVAVKLLRVADRHANARALREAQAMAKLAHPNVIAVYDVGVHEGAVFFAMELVNGTTLRDWIADAPRRWPDVLATYRAAGEGLAAAHAVGLVHRDFKPANVLIGHDGRVQVTDFGLARGSTMVSSDEEPFAGSSHTSTDGRLTQDGVVLGTPPYMAPEQSRGHDADPRSDQYAFCVALYEALFGVRPFLGDTTAELGAAKERGVPTRPVTGADVPAWLRRVVVRGLAPDPAARWSTMVDLLTALARPARRSIVLTSVLAISTLGLAGFAVLPATSELCTGRLEGVWDDAQRERVRAAFTDSDAAYAGSTLARVETGLDAYAAGWVATYEQACAATHLAADPSPELLDGRMQCLEQRRRMLGAAVQTLASTDAVVIEHAVGLVTELPAVERCDDAEYVIANVARPQDPQTRERVESVREELAEARALHGAGKYEDAAHVALRASGTAETIGDPALVAEAALRLGLAQADAGHYAEAESSLTAAFFAAREARQVEIAADASTELVAVVGGKLARPREGLQWADQARVEVEQLADPLQDAALASAIGAMHFEAGAHDLASERFEYALAIRERNLDAHHPELAQTLLNLGSVHGMRGDFDRGLEYSERALAIMREALGPDHPSVANAAGNIGNFHLSRGEPELAASVLQEAVTLAEASYGPEHPTTAKWLNNAGISYTELGRFDDALAAHRRALAIREKAFGHDHPMVARSLISIGNLQRARDNYGEARVAYARAATIFESVLGPDHADTAMALNNLGVVHEHEHDYDEALRVYRRAFVIFEAQLGTEHPSVASSHNNLGNVLEEQGALPEALQHHERALAIREKVLAPDHASIPASRKAVARVRAAIARG